MIAVVNTNKQGFSKKFDGKLYEFPSDVRVEIPEAAAAYIFAYGQPDADRARILVRNGWHRNGDAKSMDGPVAALARLQNFVFKTAAPEPQVARPQKSVLSVHAGRPRMGEVLPQGGAPAADQPGAA